MEWYMQFESFSFGSIRIDGISYDHDVLIDRGKVRKRRKKGSRKFRNAFGLTPDQVRLEAQRRKVEVVIVPTPQAVELLKREPVETNAILHVTCSRGHQAVLASPRRDVVRYRSRART